MALLFALPRLLSALPASASTGRDPGLRGSWQLLPADPVHRSRTSRATFTGRRISLDGSVPSRDRRTSGACGEERQPHGQLDLRPEWPATEDEAGASGRRVQRSIALASPSRVLDSMDERRCPKRGPCGAIAGSNGSGGSCSSTSRSREDSRMRKGLRRALRGELLARCRCERGDTVHVAGDAVVDGRQT